MSPLNRQGSGIGREAALAFASAGADRLFLIGRRQDALERTRDLVASKSVDCSIHAVSVVDEHAIKNIAATVGTWDVLILNAAFLSSPAPVAEASVEDWWQGFEVRIRKTDPILQRAFIEPHLHSHLLDHIQSLAVPRCKLLSCSCIDKC